MLRPPPAAPSALLKAKIAYSFWFKIYNDFPKAHRYILGGKIEDYFLGLLENIFISIYLPPTQKIPRLIISISKLDGVKFFLQIAWENKCVKNEKYIALSEQLEEIGRMLGGWKKGIEKNLENKNSPK
ncbi:four helix bundle protein [Candidatus Nomurabacteria bacterium]|nr:four helix bundle protein [Candidatus Nomurabacteria bacterium]